MSARLRLVTAVAVVAAVLQVAGPTGAQTSDPSVHLDRTGTAAGEGMLVTGDGWPAGATLIVELCGHGGLRGSTDCDVSQQRTAGAGASGHFSVEMTTGTPPTPCPCVIKVTDQSTRIAATAPIAVAGIPTVPITEADLPAARSIEISSIKVTGGGRWAELFGAGGRRVLEVTIVNTGPVPVEAPDVEITWGTGSRPKGFVSPPETTPMEPGDRQVLTVALDRPALTIGKQTAIVEIQGLDEAISARASTTAYPWGLVAVALVVLQLVLLWVRNRLRRRLHGEDAALVEAPGSDGGTAVLAAGPLALGAGDPATAPGDAEEEGADPVVVLDLDAPPAERVPGGTTAAVNGHGPLNGAAPLIDALAAEADAARVEIVALQLQARLALKQAVALSEAIVTASTARAKEADERAAERLHTALRRHTEAIEVLEAAKAQADQVLAAATAAAAGALRDAGSHEAGSHQALVELRVQQAHLARSAGAAIDQIMRDLDEQVARLAERHVALAQVADATDGATDGAGTFAPPSASPPAPRLGGLDHRLAQAVALAFAESPQDDVTTS